MKINRKKQKSQFQYRVGDQNSEACKSCVQITSTVGKKLQNFLKLKKKRKKLNIYRDTNKQ